LESGVVITYKVPRWEGRNPNDRLEVM
jgi:hypothetical protein